MSDDSKPVTETTAAYALASRIFELDAQYQGGTLAATCRADFIERHVVPAIEAFAAEAATAERERIIRGIDEEADTTPDHEDAMVTREHALLIRADFSYHKLDELKAADPEWAFGGGTADAQR